MNTLSRTITGTVLILGGIALVVASFFSTLFLLIHAFAAIIIGLFILFNKTEDKIEHRKDLNKTKSKKQNG